MKGDPKLIDTLNALLADELTAINSKPCRNVRRLGLWQAS